MDERRSMWLHLNGASFTSSLLPSEMMFGSFSCVVTAALGVTSSIRYSPEQTFVSRHRRTSGRRASIHLIPARTGRGEGRPMMLETANYASRTLEPCSSCGGYRRRIGVVPHEHHHNLRVDLYRCVSCDARSAESAEYQAVNKDASAAL